MKFIMKIQNKEENTNCLQKVKKCTTLLVAKKRSLFFKRSEINPMNWIQPLLIHNHIVAAISSKLLVNLMCKMCFLFGADFGFNVWSNYVCFFFSFGRHKHDVSIKKISCNLPDGLTRATRPISDVCLHHLLTWKIRIYRRLFGFPQFLSWGYTAYWMIP